VVNNRVRDYLDLPEHASVDDFIVKPSSTPAELARTYTLTSAIRPKLDVFLRDVAAALARNEDLGRFIFGSFGSGKSHFLRVAAMMLAGESALYENARDPGLRALRDAHPFLETAQLLVVETSMIGVNEEVSAFTRRLTADFDRALVDRGKPPLRPFGTKAVFDGFDGLCARVPQTMDAFIQATGYERAFHEEQRAKAHAGLDVSAFARDVARFYGVDEQNFLPSEAEAREQMAAHAQALGFRGVVFAIDELSYGRKVFRERATSARSMRSTRSWKAPSADPCVSSSPLRSNATSRKSFRPTPPRRCCANSWRASRIAFRKSSWKIATFSRSLRNACSHLGRTKPMRGEQRSRASAMTSRKAAGASSWATNPRRR